MLEETGYTERYLDEMSFYNIVQFYRDELQQLAEGGDPITIFSCRHERVKLIHKGVLGMTYKRAGRHIFIPERTRRYMEET